MSNIREEACPHLEHAVMAFEGMSRVCPSCRIERLESKINDIEIKHPEFDGSYVETIDLWHSDQMKIKQLEAKIAELEKLIEWHKKDTHDAMEWKRELESKLSIAVEALKPFADESNDSRYPGIVFTQESCQKAKEALKKIEDGRL